MNNLLPRFIPFVLIFFGSTSSLSAQMPSWICIKINIELNDESKRTGYCSIYSGNLGITKDAQGYYYYINTTMMRLRTKEKQNGIQIAETDYHFHKQVYLELYDTVNLFQQTYLTVSPQNENHLAVMLGEPEKILKKNIRDFTVEIIFPYDSEMVLTKVQPDDVNWFQPKGSKTIDLSGEDYCNYEGVLFGPITPAAQNAIDAFILFINEKYVSGYNFAPGKAIIYEAEKTRLIDNLRKEKVLVIAHCSC